jgi:charged multivesicular body protein 2A
MMQAMKGATVALGNMNRSMNLPQLQRITMEFERENDIMEQRQEMMDDAIDDAVEVEEEGDEIVNQVLDEIGVDLRQAVSHCRRYPRRALGLKLTPWVVLKAGELPSGLQTATVPEGRVAQAIGGGDPGDDDLQARLNSLRK